MTAQSSPAVALEPCPCCGTANPEMERGFTGLIDIQCMNPNCGLMIQSTNQDDAAQRWNRRAGEVEFGPVNDLCGKLATSGDLAGAKVIGDLWKAYSAAWNRRAAPRTPAETGEVEELKADLRDEINFDLNTRINKVPESVVDQVVDLLAERGLLALAALPPSSGWEAGAEAMLEAVKVKLTDAGFRNVAEFFDGMPLPPPPSKEGV